MPSKSSNPSWLPGSVLADTFGGALGGGLGVALGGGLGAALGGGLGGGLGAALGGVLGGGALGVEVALAGEGAGSLFAATAAIFATLGAERGGVGMGAGVAWAELAKKTPRSQAFFKKRFEDTIGRVEKGRVKKSTG